MAVSVVKALGGAGAITIDISGSKRQAALEATLTKPLPNPVSPLKKALSITAALFWQR